MGLGYSRVCKLLQYLINLYKVDWVEVYRELTEPDFPVAGATEVQTFDWIEVREINNRLVVDALQNELDIGEAEAIALAIEISAEQVIIDERRGRIVADRFNLKYTGILGILIEAKEKKLISTVKPLLDALRNQAGFWITELLYNRVLQIADELPTS